MSITETVAADDLPTGEEVDLVDEAEEVSADVESEEEEELPFLDIDQFKDQYVKIKVDGEELIVPLAEAVAGYQRQSDYTRKTQALAQQKSEIQWASALKGALESNPQAAIELLANQYGVRPAVAPQQKVDDPFAGLFRDDESVDPRYREIEARLQAFEEERAQQQLERTITVLSQKYGEEFNPQEVVAAALASGSTDLEATFKQIKFDKVMEDAKAAKAAASARAKKVAAKKEAAVVSGGSAKGGAGGDSGTVSSIADAWREAKRALGG